jgi:uncharacterized repeat protein (TIGR01451 family)
VDNLIRTSASAKTNETLVRRLPQALLTGTFGLLLVLGLSLLLGRFQSLAQPTPEVTALLVQKEVNATFAAPGDVLTYIITIQNSNPPAGTVWLTDTLPVELVCITPSLTSDIWEGSWGVKNNVITWTGEMYGNDSTAAITFSARISTSLLLTEIENTAQVTGTGDLIEVSSERTIVMAAMGNLDNEGTDKGVFPPGLAAQGDVLTYTITLLNDGSDPVPEVQVIDQLPPNLGLVAGSITHTYGSHVARNDVITWALDIEGTLNATETLSFRARVSPDIPDDGWITNTAEIIVPGSSFTRTTAIYIHRTHPELEASKFIYPDWARPGGLLTYTVRIHNTGDGDADTVWMSDELPPLVTYVTDSLTATMGSFGEAGGVITWNATLGPAGTLLLPDGEGASITFTVQISPELTQNILITNVAEITGVGTIVPAQANAWAIYRFYVYLPVLYKRWPPIPYAPILSLDDPEVGINDYVISWSHDHPDVSVISYTLEEASNASFTDAIVVYGGPATEKEIIDQPDGTYYYRVRGYNQYGYGAWSNTESVTVFTVYYDDFDDASSGWPNDKGEMYDDRYWRRGYVSSNEYRIYIDQGGPYAWFYQPDALAPYRPPSDKYCVETRIRFARGGWFANMGLVFGANEANTDLYALCLARDADPDKLGWFLMRSAKYEFPRRGCSGPSYKIEGASRTGTSREGWNRLQIGVDGNTVKVYIGGIYKGQWSMPNLEATTRVGVIGGDYEITPIDIRAGYFKVTPNSDCTP